NTIGPLWDANEVWLVLAGGATFAAFPQWYATLFSGFYLPLLLILVALIFRGVAFEFRGKLENPKWRSAWDICTFAGSLLPPILFGVAFANMLKGVPIDGNMNYTGGFFNLLNLYSLLGGVTFLSISILLGALFLNLKTGGIVQERAERIAHTLWIPVLVILALFLVATNITSTSTAGIIFTIVSILAGISGYILYRLKRHGLSFGLLVLASTANTATIFGALFPNVMISSLNPDWSLTIYNASSSANTLTVMSIVVAIFLPLVLAYQAWNYWVFRKRISAKVEELHY
ncbi:cytochrome d ubiquinol oxidase subunit II, partial [bacterium]|nr:cytochrome d ubiquinol oxidase subunit II [bacterium]